MVNAFLRTNLDAGHPCPLELAIEAFDALGLLLRLDADANATCTLGIPMLQFAILARKEPVIQLLLTSGGERHRTPPTGSP